MTIIYQPEDDINISFSLQMRKLRLTSLKGNTMNLGVVNQNPLLFITLWFSFLLIGSPTYIRYKQVLKHVFSTFISNTIVTSDSPARTHYIVAVRSFPLKCHTANPLLPFISCLICKMKMLILISSFTKCM